MEPEAVRTEERCPSGWKVRKISSPGEGYPANPPSDYVHANKGEHFVLSRDAFVRKVPCCVSQISFGTSKDRHKEFTGSWSSGVESVLTFNRVPSNRDLSPIDWSLKRQPFRCRAPVV